MGTAGKPLKREKNRQPGVTELVTPGIAVDENLLDHKSNNFLASLHLDGDLFGVSFLDFSTVGFFVTEGNQMHVEKLLDSFRPSETKLSKSVRKTINP